MQELAIKSYDKILKGLLYLLFFLFPLFFLPFTTNIIEYNKLALLIVLTLAALFVWMLKSLMVGKISFSITSIHIYIVIFLAIYSVSAFFSLYKYGSVWGWGDVYGESLIGLAALVILSFLISSSFNEKDVFYALCLLIASFLFSFLYSILQLYGKFFLPFEFAKTASFNTIGSVSAVAVLGAVIAPLIISMAVISRRVLKGIFIAALLADFVIIALVNLTIAWIILLVGSFLIMIFGAQKKFFLRSAWLILTIIFIAVSMLFIFYKIQIRGLADRPVDLYLKPQAGMDISLKTIKERPILGSGPGTYMFDYLKHKDNRLNNTAFWSYKTDNGGSKMITYLAELGVIGIVSLVILIGLFIYKGFIYLTRKNKADNDARESYLWLMGAGIFSSFIVLVISNFIFPANLALEFLFFSLISLFLALRFPVKKELIIKKSLAAVFCFAVIFIFSFGFLIAFGQRYAAEFSYAKGLKAWKEGDIDGAIIEISKASSINPKSDLYFMDLSKAYLKKISLESQRNDISKEELSMRVQLFIKNAVNSAVIASELNPNNVSAWSVKGFVSLNLIGVVPGIDDWALKSYDKALELEPLNPYYYYQEGIIFLSKFSSLLKQGKDEEKDLLITAKEKFEKSIELKSDYAPARFQLAKICSFLGEADKAIAELEAAKKIAPDDSGLAYELGVLYYQNNNLDASKKELERAVSIDKDYSNALFFLGIVYDKIGEREKAIKSMERVVSINPDSEKTKIILENLKSGKSALDGLTEEADMMDEKLEEADS